MVRGTQNTVITGYLASGLGSARRSSHLPKRTMASSGWVAKKSMPSIISSIGGGRALADPRAASRATALRPSIDAENDKKP